MNTLNIVDQLGRDIFFLERELETAQQETDAVIAQIFEGGLA